MGRRLKTQFHTVQVWLFAVLIGAAVGYAVIGFRMAIDLISILSFGETEETIASAAESLSFWRAWMAPVIGGFVVSGLMMLADRFDWLKNGRGQGVSDVIEARAVTGGLISLRSGLAAAAISTVSLGSGASAGREGPAVHLGATIASFLDRYFDFSVNERRTLLGCGAAAAVATSFNAPIAGVLFALEVILGNYALSIFGPISLASVTAAIIGRLHYGDFAAFQAPSYGAAGTIEVPLSALLGLLCGLTAIIFLWLTRFLTERIREIATRRQLSFMVLPPLGGALIGLMGAFHPEIFGVGYEAITRAFDGSYTLSALLVILILKFLATAITLSCRFGGGVFSPGLFLGVFAGAAFGLVINDLVPGANADPGYYAMVGMGAVAGAIMGAPISTTLIAFELTGDYGITISLMVAVSVATLITQTVFRKSFFHWQLSRRGYDLSDGPQGVLLQTIRVREVMEQMPPQNPLDKEAPRLIDSNSLGKALATLEEHDESGLPVVTNKAPDDPVGYLTRVRALGAYNRALIESHVEHHR
ncbi:MAG: chloride channel protein [Pseudomonadota bacterium]